MRKYASSVSPLPNAACSKSMNLTPLLVCMSLPGQGSPCSRAWPGERTRRFTMSSSSVRTPEGTATPSAWASPRKESTSSWVGPDQTRRTPASLAPVAAWSRASASA